MTDQAVYSHRVFLQVQISVSLLEKLAGIRKDPNPRSHKQQHSPGCACGQHLLNGRPAVVCHPDHTVLLQTTLASTAPDLKQPLNDVHHNYFPNAVFLSTCNVLCMHLAMCRLAIGQLGLPGLPRDLAAAAAAAAGGSSSHGQLDSSLQQAIQSSRRVGELLLKSEEQEVAAVQQRAQELVQQYR
jgi:hypothetical protein